MKFLRSLLDRAHPLFTKGGKFERLHPLYEALDTFLYTPADTTSGATHVRDALDLKRMMILVVLALAPCMFMAMYNTGRQANLAIEEGQGRVKPYSGWVDAAYTGLGFKYEARSNTVGNLAGAVVHGALYFLPLYLVTIVAGGVWEVVFAIVRKHEINEGFLVTSALFPLTLPPTTPLWQAALGITFGVVIGKEVFGGTGRNVFNPALTARAFLYFAYPLQITGATIWTAVDGLSRATPLGALANTRQPQGALDKALQESGVTWMDSFLGFEQGSMGETSTLACLLGAVVLIAVGVGSWRVMLGMLVGGMGLATLFWGLSLGIAFENPMFQMPPWWHLVAGGFAFGMVFMATDPVSASFTQTGRYIYGALCGAMSVLIRVVNPAFPEGVMLAILFGNAFAPLIDHFVVQHNIRKRIARSVA